MRYSLCPRAKRILPGEGSFFLYADGLWNANDSGVPYDDRYGAILTHALFEGALPAGMNVFRAVGRMLPPQYADRLVHTKYITASQQEICEIKDALDALAAKGHRLAAVYAEMAAAAKERVASLPETLLPLSTTKHFVG